MSTTVSTESDRLNLAVKKMILHQSLSVKDATKLADFSAVDIKNKICSSRGERQLKVIAMEGGDDGSIVSAVIVNRGDNADISPLSNQNTSSINPLTNPKKPKIG